MKSGVNVQSDNIRTYKKKSDSEFNHPYKNPYTVKQYKKLGENFIAIAYEHNNNSVFNILEKVDGQWKSLHKEEIPMKITKSKLKEIIKEEVKLPFLQIVMTEHLVIPEFINRRIVEHTSQ